MSAAIASMPSQSFGDPLPTGRAAAIVRGVELMFAELGLAYRVLDLCAGDLGASSARTMRQAAASSRSPPVSA